MVLAMQSASPSCPNTPSPLPGLLQRPLIDPPVERTIAAITMPGRKFSPAVDALMLIDQQTFAWPG